MFVLLHIGFLQETLLSDQLGCVDACLPKNLQSEINHRWTSPHKNGQSSFKKINLTDLKNYIKTNWL